MKKKKMYLVHREVMATSIERALKERGVVYSVCIVDDKDQPLPEKKPLVGFKSQTNGKKN